MQPGRVAETTAGPTEPNPLGRIWTIPNVISMARLA